MKPSLIALLPFVLLLAVGFSAQAEDTKAEPKPVPNYTILKIEGEEIRYNDIEKIWDALFPGEGKAPALSTFGDAVLTNIVRGVVSERLMLREAERLKMDEDKQVQEQLEALRRQLMVQKLLQERHKDLAESNVLKRYDELVAKMDGKEEVRASHILVETKDEATEVRKTIKEGKDFTEIAKERSLDKGTTTSGGDLGFFTKDQMVPEFAEAAFSLKKGELSDPVESPFGWHIIKMFDKRDQPLPTLEEVRPQIEKQLHAEADQEYIRGLLKEADVEYFAQDGKKKKLPLEPLDTSKK